MTLRGTYLSLALLAAALSLSDGCSKKSEVGNGTDAAIVQAAQALPDGTNVLAALDQKDYEAAVSGLAKMNRAVTSDQEAPFLALKMHVKTRLIELSSTDAKAADALNALRMLTQGR